MMLTTIAKENLLRLWKSQDIQNHDLAFQILEGFERTKKDNLWLWDCYHHLAEKSQHVRLINLAQLNQSDLLRGKILAILLQSETIAHSILDTFLKESIIRVPYNSLISFPRSLDHFSSQIQELIWQDGEVQAIDENILQFQQMKRLDLRRQPISFIHPSIADLPLLKEIHLISTSFLPDELMDRQDIEVYTDAPY